jgi:hypothetical protein
MIWKDKIIEKAHKHIIRKRNMVKLNNILESIRINNRACGNHSAINALSKHFTNLALKFSSEKTTICFLPSSIQLHNTAITQQDLAARIRSLEVFSLSIRKSNPRETIEEELKSFFTHVFDNNRDGLDELLAKSKVLYGVAREERRLSPAEIGLSAPQDLTSDVKSSFEDLYPIKRQDLPREIQTILSKIDGMEKDKKSYGEKIKGHLRRIKYLDFSLPESTAKSLSRYRNISSKIIEMINICQKKDENGKTIFNVSQARQLVLSKYPSASFRIAIELVGLKGNEGKPIFNAPQAVNIAICSNLEAKKIAIRLLNLKDKPFNTSEAERIATCSKPIEAEENALRLINLEDKPFNTSQAVSIAICSNPTEAEENALRLINLEGKPFNASQAVRIAICSNPTEAEQIAIRLLKLKDKPFNATQAVSIAVCSNRAEAEKNALRLLNLEDKPFNAAQVVRITICSKPTEAEENALRLINLKDNEGKLIFGAPEAVNIAICSNPTKAEQIAKRLLSLKDKPFNAAQAVSIATSSSPTKAEKTAIRLINLKDKAFNPAQAVRIATCSKPTDLFE